MPPSLLFGVRDALLRALMVLYMWFCTEIEASRLFCEPPRALKLVCSDVHMDNILVYLMTSLLEDLPLLSEIVSSHARMISSVLKMALAGEKYKVFCIYE